MTLGGNLGKGSFVQGNITLSKTPYPSSSYTSKANDFSARSTVVDQSSTPFSRKVEALEEVLPDAMPINIPPRMEPNALKLLRVTAAFALGGAVVSGASLSWIPALAFVDVHLIGAALGGIFGIVATSRGLV